MQRDDGGKGCAKCYYAKLGKCHHGAKERVMGESMQHTRLLDDLVTQLKPVTGLRAIVLGGSYARGDQRPDSDLDLGLYYSEDRLLDIAQV